MTTDTTPTFTPNEVSGDTLDDEERAELQAHRDGIGHLAQDEMHAGQPVHECSNSWDDAKYYLQITHAGWPLWNCQVCSKLALSIAGNGAPDRCVGCGAVDTLGPLLYADSAACRSWSKNYGGQYDGRCLIAGSDGCDCTEGTA